MRVAVHFYSYFRDLAGGMPEIEISCPEGTNVSELLEKCAARFPELRRMKYSTLVAVGLDYQERTHVLKDGDEVSLFPPVQGG